MNVKYVFYAALLAPGIAWTSPLVTAEKMADMRCFSFQQDSPQREPLFGPRENVVCYLQLDEQRELVFLRDQEGADPHTSAMIETHNGERSLYHFSQSMGVSTRAIQRPYALNPLPAPLTLDEALEKSGDGPLIEKRELSRYSDRLRGQINGIVQSYFDKNYPTVVIDESFGRLPETSFAPDSFYLPEHLQPRDGYWWPHSSTHLADGPNSPLAKYDAYAESLTGINPRSAEWERANHSSNLSWAGHCNGWAAATILYGFEELTLLDDKNNNIISASDLQGMRAATSFCVATNVIGKRYNGDGDDITDIHAHKFHQNLEYYVRFMQKPLPMDYLSAIPVDNHIISGYTRTYQNVGRNRALVTARVKVHGYNYTRVNVEQIARSYENVYRYYLDKDASGKIIGGEWVDEVNHPDFFWVPLAQSKCSGENPRMDHQIVDRMVKELRRVGRVN